VDCYLPFGLRTAPYIFDPFPKALHLIPDFQASPEFDIIQHLDNFPGVGTGSAATELRHQFEQICNRLGIRIKESKSITGTTADFDGIELDTQQSHALYGTRLPPAKLQNTAQLVQHAPTKDKVIHHEVPRIIGFLSFCCNVDPLGRSFLRRLYNATSHYPHSKTGTTKQLRSITADRKVDLRWWQRFLPSWSAIAIIYLEL
jgi:hypothetical protein